MLGEGGGGGGKNNPLPPCLRSPVCNRAVRTSCSAASVMPSSSTDRAKNLSV
jgi:hypothetical protein